MNILITGASGLIGTALIEHLSAKHKLTLIGRSTQKLTSLFSDQYNVLSWHDLKSLGQPIIQQQDIIINLAGENIGEKRWSVSQKEKILNSRVEATEIIANLCAPLGEKSPRILNASAIGIYGFSEKNNIDHPYTEKTILRTTPTCFLETVGLAWENALLPAESKGVPVTRMRFSVVLSKKGGALKKMLPAFYVGLGAILGNGEQLFSWVSLKDLVRAITFIIEHTELTGSVNIVSPNVVTQKVFAKALASALNRPLFLTLPKKIIHILLGQMGDELLLNGQAVKSEKLLSAGFHFQDVSIENALNQ